MPWVRFIHRFDYRVRRNVLISYRAGSVYLVKQDCADQAVAQGKAARCESPIRKADTNASR